MALFVHLVPETAAKKIRSGGLKACPILLRDMDRFRGIYAYPRLANFHISHQWLRELKRAGCRTIMGVYFRVPDSEEVLVGHYARKHTWMSASVAAGFLSRVKDPRGYETIVPRKIAAKEIQKIRFLPQTLGWRYWPEAHGNRPCGCPVCWEPGSIRSRKIREQWLEEQGDEW